MGFLKKYIKKYWKMFLTAVVFLSLEAFCDLLQPTIMSRIVDKGVAGRNMQMVFKFGMQMLLVTAVGAFGATMRNILSSNVSQRFGAELRSDMFKKIQSFSFDDLDQFDSASLVTRLTNDINQLQNFTNGLMRIFVKAPLLCIGSLIMATLLNPRLAIVLVAVVPVILLLITASLKLGYPYFVKVQNSLDKVNGVMREYLSGVRVVKAFNMFDYEVDRFHGDNEKLSEVTTGAMKVMAIFSPGITLTVNLGIIVVLWLGGYGVHNHSMKVGEIIAFINYMTQILTSLMMISFVFNMFVRAKVSAGRIGEVFAQHDTMAGSSSDGDIEACVHNVKSDMQFEPEDASDDLERGLVFKNVYFNYKNAVGEPVIKDASFTCKPDEVIGIIGSTGSGKSTLVNLIPRFYDVTSGSIRLAGIDTRNMDVKALRDRIAFVPQKTLLFTGSIISNIKWGKEDVAVGEVENVARIAQAHDFIEAFTEGYDTMLGQGGVNLSGGQKQRISIARALLKNPDILILDDCTSAVDVATEARLVEALKSYYKNLSCIIIAQRITSVMNADRIMVMDNGLITDSGTHEELMQKSEIYRDIYSSQIGKGVNGYEQQ